MHKNMPWICLILCVLISSTFLGLEAFSQRDEIVQCQVLVHDQTSFTLYTNTGRGYNESQAETIPVRVENIWRLLRFPIHHTVFQPFRLDFTAGKGEALIKQCRVQDAYGIPVKPYHHIAIQPLHQVQLEELAPYTYQAVAQGEDPQLLLDVHWLRLFFGKIHPGFWFSLIFLLYPFCTGIMHLFSADRTAPESASSKPWQHRLLTTISLVVWLMAGLAYWSAHARHTLVNTPEKGDLLYGGPSFVAQEVDLYTPAGLKIHGRVYQTPQHVAHRGRILLLHGNFADGQLHPLYPLMAESLANRGFLVLTVDFAGFGRSDDPFSSETGLNTDQEKETELALAYLKALPGEQKNIYLIGHSMGANAALRVGLRNPDVSSLVLIGPPRRVGERFTSLLDLTYFFERAQKTEQSQYDREQFPPWYSLRDFQEEFLDRDIVYSLPELAKWHHKPVHFMDGGKENNADLRFLNHYIQNVSAPCDYVTMLDADHNFNVPARAEEINYVPNNLQDAVNVLDTWCSQQEIQARETWSVVENVLRLFFPFRQPEAIIQPVDDEDLMF